MHQTPAIILLITAVLCVSLAPGCTEPERDTRQIIRPEILRIAVLPDESEAALRLRHRSLIEYLSKRLALPIELIVPGDYEDLVRMSGDGEIHLAYYGGVAFLKAHDQHAVIPIIMRDVDLVFSSLFIASPGTSAKTLAEFYGHRFAFGSRNSTSGHFMPRYFMQQDGIQPETFYREVRYSGAHDRSVYWVRDGKVDLAVANSRTVQAMLGDGRIAAGDIRIIQETPPYADYVWAVSSHLAPELAGRLMGAFLALSPGNLAHRTILRDQRAGGFLPATRHDFEKLAAVVKSVGDTATDKRAPSP